MTFPKQSESMSREDLVAQVCSLRRQVGRLQRQVEHLSGVNEALRSEVEHLRRSAKRQAAPFSKGKRVSKPKRPGRKAGKGSFSYRKPPLPEEISEPVVDVPVPVDRCSGCGGRLKQERVELAYVTDIPPVPRPLITEYRVVVCRCMSCGKRVRGEHPAVAPDQYGASAHRVGTRVMAAAHVLHYSVGIPVRKVPWVLKELTGIKLTQSAITQDALRRAKAEVGTAYARLRASVRERPAVHTDDTGWRVGGEPAFLMAFETDEATVYQVRSRHRNEEVREVVPSDYGGVMVTDRGRSYDAKTLSNVRQQKCLAHILRSISVVVETKRGRGRSFGKQLKELFVQAMELWREYQSGKVVDFAVQVHQLKEALRHHLRDRLLPDRDNQRLLDELGWHNDHGSLLRFLDDPRIEPTNNIAERALRPAVIARKVSQCSKNEPGAYAFSAFTSVLRTLARKGEQSMVEGLCQVFQSPGLQPSLR